MSIVNAVALLLAAPSGRIFLVRELKGKPEVEKTAGMKTFPLETVEEGETVVGAVHRLVREEVSAGITIDPAFFGEFLIAFSSGTIGHIFVYSGACPEEFVGRPVDTDIEYCGWCFPFELLRMKPDETRKEVRPIVKEYLKRRVALV